MLPTKKKAKECRTARQVKQYATYDGVVGPLQRQLGLMAPAAAAAAVAAPSAPSPQSDANTADAVMTTSMKAILKAARYTVLPKRSLTIANVIAASMAPKQQQHRDEASADVATAAAAAAGATKRILAARSGDRDAGVAIGVTQVAVDVATPQNARHFLVITAADAATRSLAGVFRNLASAAKPGPDGSPRGAYVSTVTSEGAGGGCATAPLQLPTAKDGRRGCVCVVGAPSALLALPAASPVWKIHFAAVVVSNTTVPPELRTRLFGQGAATAAPLRIVVGEPALVGSELTPPQLPSDAATQPEAQRAGEDGATLSPGGDKERGIAVDFVVAEGLHRLQLLYSIISNSGTTKRIVVAFATPQTCSFALNLFFALKVEAEIIADDESAESAQSALAEFEGKKAGEGCVLFTCRGLKPASGDVFVQYDPITIPLSQFTSQIIALRGGSKRKRDEGSDRAVAGSSSSSPASPFSFVILFVYPSEQRSIVPILHAGGRGRLLLKKLEVTNTVRYLVTLKKIGALLKKVFILNAKAYEAYRSLMLVYSHLKPKSVFDVSALDLTQAAQQFGLEDAPLLDLRTKDNDFRPREDFGKMAMLRFKKEQREMIHRAAEKIKPEE